MLALVGQRQAFLASAWWAAHGADSHHGWDCTSSPEFSGSRGIQGALGVFVAVQVFRMIATWWVLGIVATTIVAVLRQNRCAPAAIVLMVLGATIMWVTGQLMHVGVSLPLQLSPFPQ